MKTSIKSLLSLPALPIQQPDPNLGQKILEKSDIARATLSSINQYQTVLALTNILLAAPMDIFADIKILAGTPERKRDREKLLEIDQMITTQMTDVIARKGLFTLVPPVVAGQLDRALQSFANGTFALKKNQDGVYTMITQKVTYEQMIRFLRVFNMTIKNYHANKRYARFLSPLGKNIDIGMTDAASAALLQQKSDTEKMVKFVNKVEGWRDRVAKESLTENATRSDILERATMSSTGAQLWIWTIEDKYACGQAFVGTDPKGKKDFGFACSPVADIGRENVAFVKNQVVRDAKSAGVTFSEAFARLRALFTKASPEKELLLQQRKRALMQGYRGAEVDERMETGIARSARNRAKLRKSLIKKEINARDASKSTSEYLENYGSNVITSLKENVAKIDPDTFGEISAKRAYIRAVNEQAAKEITIPLVGDDVLNLGSNEQQRTLANTTFYLRQSVMDTLSLQQQRQESAIIRDVTPITRQFPVLSRKVYATIQVIGSKNERGYSNEGTLVNSMGQVCELQCTNSVGKCRGMED